MKRNVILSCILITIILSSKLILNENYIFFLKIYTTLLIVGGFFFPMTSYLFSKLYDKGWLFSKVIGFTISGLIVWLMMYAKLLNFNRSNCWIIILILAIINAIVFLYKYKLEVNNDFKKTKVSIIKNILVTEIIFCIVFVICIYIKSYNVQITNQTEQFMDYGFMNAIFNSSYMPVEDIWLSGNNINYYYFGQYISSFIVKISGLKVNEGYNLMIALITTFIFTLSYSISWNLAYEYLKKTQVKKLISKILPYMLGIIVGLSLVIGGTLYYPIYNWILDRPEEYFYTDATRYIGYRPETQDKTITEPPSYSIASGDLHAHFTDTIFVFTILALFLQLLLCDKQTNWKSRLKSKNILIFGLILAIQKMTNYWDFPIYIVITTIFIIANNIIKCKINKENILITLAQIVEIIFLEELITIPFSKDLYISATKVLFTNVTSPLYKLIVLWGFPILCVILFLISLSIKLIKQKNKFIEKLRTIDKDKIFITIISLSAIGLIILPEIIYLKDIYSEEFKRANTMFKLTYQAQILLSISVGYIIMNFITEKGNKIKKMFAIMLLIIYISTFGYGINAHQYILKNKQPQTLSNNELYIKNECPDDYEAIQWIKQNLDRDEIILEATDGSYTTSSRISVFSANPTVLGWHGHEWIWRATKDYMPDLQINERWKDVNEIYTSTDKNKVKQLVEKYNISYIYIGNVEYKKYINIDLNLFERLGNVIYINTNYIQTPVYIIKIK